VTVSPLSKDLRAASSAKIKLILVPPAPKED
jgi:hypothetical protein